MPGRGGRPTAQRAMGHAIAVAEHPSPGVNLIGFLQAEFGLGEVGRQLSRAVEQAGVPLSTIAYKRTAARQEHPFEDSGVPAAPYDTNILCVNPDHLRGLARDLGVELFARRYSIGVWFWETTKFPQEFLEGFRYVDEVWVGSEFVRGVVAAETQLPVHVVPLPIEAPATPRLSRSELGLPEGFLFLFSFDFYSVFERKNPLGLVEAFKRAFAPGEGPVVVIKTINGDRKASRLQVLREAADERPDIFVIDGYVSADAKNAMMAACDCYVSLHRSEGFGLTMAEAMSYGRPVIATGFSGNLVFMDESNSYLVPYELARIPSDWSFSPGAEWADPDIEAAAALMRRVYENQDEARARGERAREDILGRFSLDRTAAFISERLSEIRLRRALAAQLPADDVRIPILRATAEVGKGIGGGAAGGADGARTSIIRRFLLRALEPYLAEQQRLNSALLDAVTMLQRSHDQELQRLARLEALSLPQGEQPNAADKGDDDPHAASP